MCVCPRAWSRSNFHIEITVYQAMEALWNLEDKLKLTTQESLLLFVCTAVAVVGLCTATVLKKKGQKKKAVDGDDSIRKSERVKWDELSCDCVSIKSMMMMSSVRWSGAKKWEERRIRGWKEREPPLLGLQESLEAGGGVGWQSHNSSSPVWQRPILMGEKCELPSFSGIILYDERGKPLDHSLKEVSQTDDAPQEKPSAVMRTTLKDLL